MTSCVEKLNVLLDHWAVFDKNHNNPDLNYWNKVINQEYEDDKMDAAAAFADIAAADALLDDLPLPSAPPADLPIPSAPPADQFCIPVEPPNDMCKNKQIGNLHYTTYCPAASNCRLKNKCVTRASHCLKTGTKENAKADNSFDIQKNRIGDYQEYMKINNQAKK